MFPVNRSVAEFQSDCSVVRERALCNFLNGLGDHCVDTCSVGSEWSPFSLFSVLLPFWALVGQLLRGVSRLCPQGGLQFVQLLLHLVKFCCAVRTYFRSSCLLGALTLSVTSFMSPWLLVVLLVLKFTLVTTATPAFSLISTCRVGPFLPFCFYPHNFVWSGFLNRQMLV